MTEHEPWDPQAFIRHYDEEAARLGIPPFPAGDSERLREEEASYARFAIDGNDMVMTLREMAERACRIERNRATQEPWDEEKFIRCYNAIVKRIGGRYYQEGIPGQSLKDLKEDYRLTDSARTIEEFARRRVICDPEF